MRDWANNPNTDTDVNFEILSNAVWVKANGVYKYEIIVLLKVETLPSFLCYTKNMIHCSLNYFKAHCLEIWKENQYEAVFSQEGVVCSTKICHIIL